MKTEFITLLPGKKVYIASDFHLGIDGKQDTKARETKVVQWLQRISNDAQVIIFLGDLFDFWFEYTHVVPKGFLRLQGAIASLADSGVKFYFFKGNHDLWMFDYFEKEFGAKVAREPILFHIGGRTFYLAHGDGLGPGDFIHKFLLLIFESAFFQWLFKMISPEITFRIATFWSGKSRQSHAEDDAKFLGEDEWLWSYAKSIHNEVQADFYIFGHRHVALDLQVGDKSRYINTGQWLDDDPYIEISEEKLVLTSYDLNPVKTKVY